MTDDEIKELIDSGETLENLEQYFRKAIAEGVLTYERLENVAFVCKNDPGLYTYHPNFEAREKGLAHGCLVR